MKYLSEEAKRCEKHKPHIDTHFKNYFYYHHYCYYSYYYYYSRETLSSAHKLHFSELTKSKLLVTVFEVVGGGGEYK